MLPHTSLMGLSWHFLQHFPHDALGNLNCICKSYHLPCCVRFTLCPGTELNPIVYSANVDVTEAGLARFGNVMVSELVLSKVPNIFGLIGHMRLPNDYSEVSEADLNGYL